MKLVKIDGYFVNPEKVVALSQYRNLADMETTCIHLGGDVIEVREDIEYVYAKLTQIGANR